MIKDKKKIRKIIILSVILVCIAYIAITTVSIYSYSFKDEKCNADVAIILGAGASEEGGVSPVYRERLNHGIWLYENGQGFHFCAEKNFFYWI